VFVATLSAIFVSPVIFLFAIHAGVVQDHSCLA
jgi:hypothetical protein